MPRLRLAHVWWLSIPVALLVLITVWHYRQTAGHAKDLRSPEQARQDGRPIPVRTARVSSGQTTTVVGATAVTVPSAQVSIRPALSQRIMELNPVVKAVHVHDGSAVQEGQLLFELDTALFEQAVAQKTQALQVARADLAQSEAALKENATIRQVELENATKEVSFRERSVAFHKEEFERLEALFQRANASVTERLEAAVTYVEAEAALTKALARKQQAAADIILGPLEDAYEVKRATGEVERAQLELTLAQCDGQQCQFRSPLNGYVDEVGVCAGQNIGPSMILGQVLQIDPVHVRLDFPQERIDHLTNRSVGVPPATSSVRPASLTSGLTVELVFDTFPQEVFEGKIVHIPVRVDTSNRVLPVVVEVANPEHRIKVGVSGYARVCVARPTTAVPAVAVIRTSEKAMVFVVQDGHATIREIKTGDILGTGVLEVTAGLEEGNEVVIYGQQYLRENDAVDTDWRSWAGRN